MTHPSRFSWRLRVLVVLPISLVVALIFAFSSTAAAFAQSLVQLSTDLYTKTRSQHQTEVEPDTYSFGNTTVSASRLAASANGSIFARILTEERIPCGWRCA